jgi:hypothetical protein
MINLVFLGLVLGLLLLAIRAGGIKLGAGLVCWLVVLAGLAHSGFLAQFEALPPRLPLVLAPALVAVVLLSRRAMALPQVWLIGFQSFRVVMELILWLLYREGRIPIQMTFEGRNFDILAGLSAPIVAWGVARRGWSQKVVGVWNAVCLLLLANIVIVALLSTPGPLRQFHNEPTNTIVAAWPFVWLPGFVVPCALFGHLSLTRILRATSRNMVLEA